MTATTPTGHRILITGTGGPAGINVLQHLHTTTGHSLYAADADPDATGLHLCDPHHQIILPRADNPTYMNALRSAVTTHNIDTILATTAEELELLSTPEHQHTLTTLNVTCPTAPHNAIVTCNNKDRFALALADANVAHPVTATDATITSDGPWIVKPANGRGSRGISYHTTRETITDALNNLDGPGIVQQVADGTEFTADTLTLINGDTVTVAARWRLETKAGISTKGRTFTNPEVTAAVTAAINAVGLTGPACVQGFVNNDAAVTIIEINPRYSGGLALTLAAGADTVNEHLHDTWGEPINTGHLTATPNITMYRYFDAVYTHTNSQGATTAWTPTQGDTP